MSRTFVLPLALSCLLAGLLCACDSSPPPANGDGVSGTAHSAGLAEDGRGDGYEYHVRYPELAAEWTALNKALRAYASERIRQLLDKTTAAERSANAAPAVLDLEFNIARRTEAFASVLAQGTLRAADRTDQLAAAFVLHVDSGKLVAITDLFTDADAAVRALSSECARQLQGRYEAGLRQNGADGKTLASAVKAMQQGVARGTAPDAANFAVFLVDGIDSKAIGLTLIFTQAQLGMSSGGEQQVEVPSKVFFELLKPEYRDAFTVDVQALAPGVR
jgi:hypothetical protein